MVYHVQCVMNGTWWDCIAFTTVLNSVYARIATRSSAFRVDQWCNPLPPQGSWCQWSSHLGFLMSIIFNNLLTWGSWCPQARRWICDSAIDGTTWVLHGAFQHGWPWYVQWNAHPLIMVHSLASLCERTRAVCVCVCWCDYVLHNTRCRSRSMWRVRWTARCIIY